MIRNIYFLSYMFWLKISQWTYTENAGVKVQNRFNLYVYLTFWLTS